MTLSSLYAAVLPVNRQSRVGFNLSVLCHSFLGVSGHLRAIIQVKITDFRIRLKTINNFPLELIKVLPYFHLSDISILNYHMIRQQKFCFWLVNLSSHHVVLKSTLKIW